MNEILVSICCITYNHEKYIRDALDGFLMQKTAFKYEVLIHDDASTDRTADIIKEYEKKYPDIIKPIYQTVNQYSQGKKITYEYQFPRVKGKYVALCEGDDYWSDCHKLQKQFDFLEQNEQCVFCTHCVQTVYESGNVGQRTLPTQSIQTKILTSDNVWSLLLKEQFYPFQTSSYFFRSEYLNEIVENRPEFMNLSKVGDTPLILYYLSKGNFGYINQTMSCYRMLSKGSWSATTQSNHQLIDKAISTINSLKSYNKYTGGQYKEFVDVILKNREFHLLLLQKRYKAVLSKRYKAEFKDLSGKERIFILLCAHVPWFEQFYLFFNHIRKGERHD